MNQGALQPGVRTGRCRTGL